MRYETEVVIDAPAEQVWETLFAVERWPEWTPTVDSSRRLEDGPLRVGGRAELKQPGQKTAVWTVTELVPGESFTWSSGGRALLMTAEHHVWRRDGATVVRLTFALSGPLKGLGALLGGGRIRSYVDTECRSLKTWCEQHATTTG